jgi:hypothetical protein
MRPERQRSAVGFRDSARLVQEAFRAPRLQQTPTMHVDVIGFAIALGLTVVIEAWWRGRRR